jgi:hypothetical protein
MMASPCNTNIGGYLSTKLKSDIGWRRMNDHISPDLEINPELFFDRKQRFID